MKKLFSLFLCILCASIFTVSGQSGFANAGEIPATRSVGEFIDADGNINLDAVRMAGYEGALDLGGFDIGFDPSSGEPIIRGSQSIAPADNPDDQYWEHGPSYQGINGFVYALAVYDGSLIAGGRFSIACDKFTCNIAMWDGNSWAPLGSGVTSGISESYVFALTIYDGKLIAGGAFLTAGEATSNNIAAWDGISWTPLGSGTDGWIYTLTAYGDTLIAGGSFGTAGGLSANRIASWDGAAWVPLGSGMNGDVKALCTFEGMLIAGGTFTTAGGVSADHIASWDGAAWDSIGTGMNGNVNAIAVFNNDLIAGGTFTTAGDNPASRIAAWDGASWVQLGSGMSGTISALAIHDNDLIAGGNFLTAGGVPANRIAAWDGDSWVSFGSGSTKTVGALTTYDGMLICGGTFQTADGSMANYIAAWDDDSWLSLGSGSDGVLYAMIEFDGLLVAGGDFRSIDGVRANNIASWDGMEWSPLGPGVDGAVQSLTVYDGKLIAGGSFLNAGGVSAKYIASWDGASWSSIGAENYRAPASTVNELITYSGKLLACVGGRWEEDAALLGWNGTAWSKFWSVYDSNGILLYAMTVFDDRLMVGLTIGCNDSWPSTEIHALDGAAACEVIYSVTFGDIYSLAVHDGKLIVGGSWNVGLDSWDGATWTNILPDIFKFNTDMFLPYCISTYEDKLVVGGIFSTGESGQVTIFTLDDSELSLLGSSTDERIYALADYGKLAVGGSFRTAGGKISASFAQWDKPGPTAVMITEFDAQPVECGVELSWALYADERIEGYRIYRSLGEEPDEILLNERLLGAEERTFTDETAVPGERYRYALAVILADGREVRSIQAEAELAPLTAKLFQNVPNPFNPATSIRYTVPRESRVTVSVYSSSGALVRTLVDEMEPAGVRQVTWDGRNDKGAPVASGIYFCRFRAGKDSLSKKMLLLR